MSTEPFQFIIIDGPTVDRMLDSFKYAQGHEKIHVNFRIEAGMTVTMIVKALGYTPGTSGHLLFEADITSSGKGTVSGYYNATTRSGSFTKSPMN